MFLVNDILLLTKARLRTDISPKNDQAYSDNELIDYVNMAYMTIAAELKIFKKSIRFELDDKSIYPYPNDFLEPLSCFLNGKEIAVKSFDSRIGYADTSVSFINEGIKIDQKTGIFEMFYNSFKRVNDAKDELYLKEFAKECVLFYVMYLALQKEQRSDSLNKSNNYLKLFNIELSKVRQIYAALSESKNIRTSYKRV